MARRLLHFILSTESATQTGTKAQKESSTCAKPAPSTTQRTQETKPPPTGLKTPNVILAQPVPSSQPIAPKVEPSQPIRHPSTAKPKLATVNAESAGRIKRALQVISEESGIDSEELGDDTVLSDVGIDSLLGLMIVSRSKDELAVDIDSATLHGLDTIRGWKKFLGGVHGNSVEDYTAEADLDLVPETKADHQNSDDLPVVTAILESKNEIESGPPEIPALEDGGAIVEGQFAQILQIISEESGIDAEEFADDTVFTDIEIDSLLSMMITSRLRDELDVGAGNQTNLFLDCHTLGELRLLLTPQDESKAQQSLGVYSSSTGKDILIPASSKSSSVSLNIAATDIEQRALDEKAEDLDTSLSSEEPVTRISKSTTQPRRATSVILQGRP